jgi:hypothetical protein
MDMLRYERSILTCLCGISDQQVAEKWRDEVDVGGYANF